MTGYRIKHQWLPIWIDGERKVTTVEADAVTFVMQTTAMLFLLRFVDNPLEWAIEQVRLSDQLEAVA